MYSLLLLLTVCSLLFFARFFNAANSINRNLIALFAVNLLLVYTQYFGWLVVGLELIFLALQERRKLASFSLSVLALILLFSPWAYAITAKVATGPGGLERNIGSFRRPQFLDDLIGYYALLNGKLQSGWKMGLGMLLFGIPVLLWIWKVFKGDQAQDKRQAAIFCWLAMFAFAPAVFLYSVSQLLPQSVWGTRFLIIVSTPYMILLSVAVYQIRLPLRSVFIVLLVSSATLAGYKEVNNSGKNKWEPLVRQMIESEPSRSDGIMVYTFGSSDETIKFYLDEAHEARFQTRRVKGLAEMVGDHFWVALRESKAWSPQKELTDSGYQVGEGFRDGFDALLFPAWRR
jgi:hypothetical protein